MSDTEKPETEAPEAKKPLPDRLSLDPRSDYFDEEVLRHGVGIRFNGAEKTNVEEYCISEGWIRMTVGRSRGLGGEKTVGSPPQPRRGQLRPIRNQRPHNRARPCP